MTTFAERLSTVLAEVKRYRHIRVESVTQEVSVLPEAERRDLIETIERDTKLTLPERYRDYVFGENKISLYWDYKLGRREENGGELSLLNLHDVLATPPLKLWIDDMEAAEKELLQELRPFDSHPTAGDGEWAALRVRENALYSQVWYYTSYGDCLEMDLGYEGYLDAVLDARGYFGWQYLFTDVDLQSRNDDLADRLKTMFEDLPRLFPETDIAPYRARFAKLKKRK